MLIFQMHRIYQMKEEQATLVLYGLYPKLYQGNNKVSVRMA